MCSLPTSSSSGSRQFVLCCLLVCVSLVRQYLLLMYKVHCHFSSGVPKWMTIHDMYVVHTAKNLCIPSWPFKACCEESVTPNMRRKMSKMCLIQSHTFSSMHCRPIMHGISYIMLLLGWGSCCKGRHPIDSIKIRLCSSQVRFQGHRVYRSVYDVLVDGCMESLHWRPSSSYQANHHNRKCCLPIEIYYW